MPFNKIFSHHNDSNFNDYLKNKKGKEILKNLKSKSKSFNTNINIDKFVSYEERRLLTTTYYDYLNNITNINILNPTSLNKGQTSFIICEKNLDHLNVCNECSKESESESELEFNFQNSYNNCKELKKILYPYGFCSNNINNNFNNDNVNNDNNNNNKNNNINKNKNNNKIDLSIYLNRNIFPQFSENKYGDRDEKTSTEIPRKIKTEMYPTINKFIFDYENNIDYFMKQSKMKAFSVYPHIISNKNIEITEFKENYYHYPSNFYNNFDQFIAQNNNNNNNQSPSFNLPISKDTSDDKSNFTNTKIQSRIIPDRNIIDIAVLSQEYSNK